METVKKFLKWLDPKDKPIKHRLILSAITFAAVLVAGVCLGIVGLYFSANVYKLWLLKYYLTKPLLVLLNCLPYVLVMILVWAATDRAWIGFLSSSVICLVYSFAAYWKLIARDDALYASDLSLIKEAMQMSGSYAGFTWQMVLAVVLVAVGTVVFFFLFRGKMPHLSVRIALPIAVVGVSALLYTTVYTSEKTYGSFELWKPLNPLYEKSEYISRGGIYPFIYSIPSAFPDSPAGYDKNESREMLLEYQNDGIPEDKQVNFVFVMLEAFADLTDYTDCITEGDPYAAYHALQKESYCGQLVTNIFAGGTVNTERCVLTGFYDLPDFRKTSWSYARYFSEQGYLAEGAHAGYQGFYSRSTVNANLGFDEYKFIENYYSGIVSGIPMDNVLLPDIAERTVALMESGEKLFSFNVTYQNHGPYSSVLKEGGFEYVVSEDIPQADRNVVNNYLTGVEDTSERILAMVEEYRDCSKPVVLVFFGDHKPWLGENSTIYTKLGIDLYGWDDVSFYNHYNTEYLIWANDTAKAVLNNDFVGEGPDISPCFLMNVLFEQCGYEGPSYMKFSNEIRSLLPVITTNDCYVSGGRLLIDRTLEDAHKAAIAKMQKVQFYLAIDSDGRLPN